MMSLQSCGFTKGTVLCVKDMSCLRYCYSYETILWGGKVDELKKLNSIDTCRTNKQF